MILNPSRSFFNLTAYCCEACAHPAINVRKLLQCFFNLLLSRWFFFSLLLFLYHVIWMLLSCKLSCSFSLYFLLELLFCRQFATTRAFDVNLIVPFDSVAHEETKISAHCNLRTVFVLYVFFFLYVCNGLVWIVYAIVTRGLHRTDGSMYSPYSVRL